MSSVRPSRVRLTNSACVFAFSLASGAGCCAQAGRAPVDAARLVQGVRAAQARIRSIRCTITVTGRNAISQLKTESGVTVPAPPERMAYRVAEKGDKLYTDDLLAGRSGNALRFISDGKQTYENLVPKDPRLGPSVMWAPVAGGPPGVKAWMYNVQGKNILDLLSEGRYLELGASSTPDLGPVFTVTFDASRHLSTPGAKAVSVDIAPVFGYAVARVRTDGQVTQEITRFTRVEGIPLPAEARRVQPMTQEAIDAYHIPRERQGEPMRVETIAFTDLGVNDVPDSLFAVNIKPGDIYVEDGNRYRIGPRGERVFERSDRGSPGRQMWTGWLFMASTTAAVLLGLGALVRRRLARRRRPVVTGRS